MVDETSAVFSNCYCVCVFLAENGMLASRIEILTRYHNDTVKKMGMNTVGVTVCVGHVTKCVWIM